MLQTPDDLSKIIREIAARQAKARGKDIFNEALNRISIIPNDYAVKPTISVDLVELESMLSDIIDVAAKNSQRTIGGDEIEAALKKVTCHYLWFC